MAQDRTAGYDMLVQISESEINNQLATAFLSGSVFPPSMMVQLSTADFTGNVTFIFQTPIADLDRSRPKMGITIPFANSQLIVTAPAALTIEPLNGSITIVDDIQVIAEGRAQTVVMDFNEGAPSTTIIFDGPSQALLAPLLAAAGLSQDQAQNQISSMILDELRTTLQRIDLSASIPVFDDTDPSTVFNIDVTTINDSSGADRDCIAMGIKMANDSGGNINQVVTNFIPAGSQSLVMMSNFWLLARVIRPMLADSLGLSVSDFDTPLRLNKNVSAPGGQGTLTRLEAIVDGNRIRVDGRAKDSGTGWSAVADFYFFIDISLSGGAMTITATTPIVKTHVDLAWYVWLASLGLGAIFFGLPGVLVSAIVLAIVTAVAEGVVDNLISSGISGSIGAIPAIPLGPIGSGLSMTSLLLDDLEFRCSIMKSISIPIKSRGQHSSIEGFCVDLETGVSRKTPNRATDLIWDPSRGITIGNTAGFTITNIHYDALTPVQISRMGLNRHSIPLNSIPLTLPSNWLFFPHQEVVFGIRTAEGRMAKVKAWRSITEGGAVKLTWVTYDTAIPALEIVSKWVVVERENIKEYITSDCQFCRSSDVKWRGIFEAKAKLMAFPIDYQWCMCGEILKDEEGEITSNGSKIIYRKIANKLIIETTEIGQRIDCEVCVSAIDHKARELFVCKKINIKGKEITCRKCGDKPKLVDLVYLPINSKLLNWRPMVMKRIAEHNNEKFEKLQ